MRLKVILVALSLILGIAWGYWALFYSSERATVESFAKLPVRIKVVHSPNPADGHLRGQSSAGYTWEYGTSVSNMTKQPIKVIEFYGFTNHDGKWECGNYTGKIFGTAEFSQWYGCPDGILVPGETYTCSPNWSGNSTGKGSTGLWLYVGVDQSSQRVKGQAQIVRNPVNK